MRIATMILALILMIPQGLQAFLVFVAAGLLIAVVGFSYAVVFGLSLRTRNRHDNHLVIFFSHSNLSSASPTDASAPD